MCSEEICCKEKCTGCYACYNICPKSCIEMKEDEYGFSYPKIDMNKCIGCNLCRKCCPSINKVEFNMPKTAYACYSLNESDRKSSTSGGAASIFSSYILNNSGVVVGAAFEDKEVKHIKIDKKDEISKLKGSKYVQSKIGNIYKKIKEDLDNDILVLFIGTPCQVAGLKKYLFKDYDNLFLIDIICHGVPSPKYLNDYIYESIGNEDFNKIIFRDELGFNFKLLKDNDLKFSKSMNKSLYYKGFMEALFYRENCYSCLYARSERVSDITIGDFWGLGEKIPFSHDTSNGISVLLPNTKKGFNLIEKCSKKMFLEKRDIKEAVDGNKQLREPSVKHKNYNKFKKLYVKNNFNYAAIRSLRKEMLIEKIKDNKSIYFIVKNIKRKLTK